MAQDVLNNFKIPSNVNRMMGTAKGEKGAYNGAKIGYGYGNKTNNGNKIIQTSKTNRSIPALYPATTKLHMEVQATAPTSERIQNQ